MKTDASSSLLAKQSLIDAFAREAQVRFEQYRSDRQLIVDDDLEEADGMYKCMQNRTLYGTMKTRGFNHTDDEDPRANLGSTLYYRATNQTAASLAIPITAGDIPFTFELIANDQVDLSAEDGARAASQRKAVARWVMKQDKFKKKWVDVSVMVGKYTNQPVKIFWKEVKRDVLDPADGTFKPRTIYSLPSVEPVITDNLYTNPYVGSIEDQECVVILSVRSLKSIQDDVRAGYFDQDALKKIVENKQLYQWDGSTGYDVTQEKGNNSDKSYSPNTQGRYLQWDVYFYAPVNDKGEWDDMADVRLIWGTFVGNALTSGVCLRLDTNFDPDNEIPIIMVHGLPDDSDMLYHTTAASVVRSNYSALATATAQWLDNVSDVNNPPMLVNAALMDSKVMKRGKDKVWKVKDVDKALKQLPPRDVTQTQMALISYLNEDTRRALNQGANDAGESYGARTSATEVATINRANSMPDAMLRAYVYQQFFPWYARKIISYMLAYAPNGQIVAISDDDVVHNVSVDDIAGDFDVEVSILTELEEDQVAVDKLRAVVQMAASNPLFVNSPTHRLDIGELWRTLLQRWRIPNIGKIVLPAGADTASQHAKTILAALEQGVFVPPQPGEDHAGILRILEAEMLRWKGVTGEQRPPWLALLDQQIIERKAAMMVETQQAAQAAAGAAGGAEGGGTGAGEGGMPQIPTGAVQTAGTTGRAIGNQIAGAMAGVQ